MNRHPILSRAVELVLGLPLSQVMSHAQLAGKIYRVGVLINGDGIVNKNPSPQFEELRRGMARLGYIEGMNVIYEVRFSEQQLEHLPDLATELVARSVDVIAAFGCLSADAAGKASATVPIVADPAVAPFTIDAAATLQRPGKNLTGEASNAPGLLNQLLQIFTSLHPTVTRIAILSNSDSPGTDTDVLAPMEQSIMATACKAGLVPQVLKVRGPEFELERAFRDIMSEHAEALIVLDGPATVIDRKRIAELAAWHRLPTMFWSGADDSDGLLRDGTKFTGDLARLPAIIDKMLKETGPADTPFEVVSQRNLAINLKAASEQDMSIPAELRRQADHVA